MSPEVSPAASPNDAVIAENMLTALRAAGPLGATGRDLALENIDAKRRKKFPVPLRLAVLASLIETGRVRKQRKTRGTRYVLAELMPTTEGVAAKILALTSPDDGRPPVLWRKNELAHLLAAAEKPLLLPALTWLEGTRKVLRVSVSKSGERYLFADPVRRWFGSAGSAPPAPPAPPIEQAATVATGRNGLTLLSAYARAVRESGGFPDVRISTLRRALPPADAAELPDRLRALWREGQLTLSLGDWSLASEEMRQAAVELEGERYLLVRFEEDAGGVPSPA